MHYSLGLSKYQTKNGRVYRIPSQKDINTFEDLPNNIEIPQESMQIGNKRNFNTPAWGINKFGQMFLKRQLLTLHSLISNIKKLGLNPKNNYEKALYTYLAILIDRVASRNTNLGVWHIHQETVEHPFGRQAIPMVFDFPEMNPLSNLSGGIEGQLESIKNYIESESNNSFFSNCLNASSGDINQFKYKELTSVVTDPPYYDAIAYADLSDFFYVWLKRTLRTVYPLNFAIPQTPKTEECTALKHHHKDNYEMAKNHFEMKLLKIFSTLEYQTSNIISIMFAHQSTQAWSTLCNSILSSKMNITSSWSNDTEVTIALKKEKAVLSSSVTVACKPVSKEPFGEFKTIRQSIETTIRQEVKLLYGLGFRGADLLTACFGQAVKEFGKYETVEKADGSKISVEELLKLAREAAFNAIISDIDTDDVTKFYIGWLNLFGFTEAEHDDVRRITQIGLNININDLQNNHILLTSGNKQTLATFQQRNDLSSKLGESKNNYTIDLVHKAMSLFKSTNRMALLKYIAQHAATPDNNFWRVANSLAEILPAGIDDHTQVSGLITNKESLIRESKNIQSEIANQGSLEM